MTRIDNLRKSALTEGNFNGYLILNGINQLYFLGFPGTSALLVPAGGECTLYVHGVNYEQAKAMGKGFRVELVKADENLMAKISADAKNCGISKLVVDSLGVQSWRNLTGELANRGIELEVNCRFIEALRMVKDKQEIDFMRKAGDLTSEGMNVAYEIITPGLREFEVAAEIEYAMRRRGGGPTAFETIVASGACASFPHGGCSDREIREGDLVVVDIGSTYNYYCSDMTRTMVAGKPSAKQQKIFNFVKKSQQSAFDALKAGVVDGDVDLAARQLIADAGYGEYFVHRLGHGVGLEVHEAPSMGPNGRDKLPDGCVVTDEPGIYIPGFGGVRIEDTVLVRENGAEKLTKGAYSLCLE